MLFTSGTTGKPKGVVLSHLNLFWFQQFYLEGKFYSFHEKDKFLQTFELTFDFAGFAYLNAFALGATLVLPNRQKGQLMFTFLDLIQKEEVTVVAMVGSILNFYSSYLEEIKLPSLRYSLFGGAPLSTDLVRKWVDCVPNASVRNVYGPSETGIICSDYNVNDNLKNLSTEIVPIGSLFPSFDYILLDDEEIHQFQGELCLGGPQVMESYLDPSHNDRFIIYKGNKYFKTGDYVNTSDGECFHFNKRMDLQVKINGYRVEINEIEKAIQHITGLDNVVLKVSQEGLEAIACVIAGRYDVMDLKKRLINSLPNYMVPKFVFIKDALPLNNNQKLDRAFIQRWVNQQMIH